MNKFAISLFLVALAGFAGVAVLPAALAQNTGTVSGTVYDEADGSPLPGANVFVPALGIGTAAGSLGEYILTLSPGSHTIVFSFTGYRNVEMEVTVEAGLDQTVDASLTPGIELDPIQVTAGRRAEKALDAPASIDVVAGRDIELETAPSPVRALRNVTSVDIAQTGVDRHEVVLRGFNNAFSGSAYVLTDYRQANVASLGVNVHSILPATSVDLERVEIVRGPGSALYGPGVMHGVIHYITKDPFTYPGATFSVRTGQQSLLDFQGRVAGVVGNNVGLKITGAYTSATDFALENCSQELIQAQRFSECPDELDAIQIAADGLRNTAFRKLNVNGNAEFRFGSNSSLIANVGHSQITATLLSGIGTVQGDGFGYTYGQVRFQSGGFFTQAYVNQNAAGKSFVYGGDSVKDRSRLFNWQAQYDLQLANGREQIIVGADVEMTRPDTEGTILGRNENSDASNEYGAYAQALTKLSDKLELTIAARADYNDIFDKLQFSPRAGIVFKPAPTSSFRLTYNRAFASPGTNSSFLDIIAGELPGTGIQVRALGLSKGFTWNRDPTFALAGAPTDLVASSLIPGLVGTNVPVGLPTGDVYAALHHALTQIPIDQLVELLRAAGIQINATTAGVLVDLLSPDQTPVEGFSPGVMGLLNLSSFSVDTYVNDLDPIDPLRQTVSQTFEVGYRGIIEDRVLLAVDGYYTQAKDFIGPLSMKTPFVLVPSLAQDLTRDIATGITNNAWLAGTLQAFGLTPEAVATLLVQMGVEAGGIPSPTTPVAIVQPNENHAGVGNVPELMLSYGNFGEVDFYGVDASVHVIASENLSVFGNMSWVSDNFFNHMELGESSESMSLSLNVPMIKYKFGGSYAHSSGVAVSTSARFTQGFRVRSGAYIGKVDDYFLVDLAVRYSFGGQMSGLSADIGVSNILNNVHREFIGAPKVGRVAIGRLTYSFGAGH